MKNLLNKLKIFFVSPIDDLKDTKENNRLTLLKESEMEVTKLLALKSSFDKWNICLNVYAYDIYTFIKKSNNEELKAYLTPKLIQIQDRYFHLENLFFLLNKSLINLNQLIEMLNQKESFTPEMMAFFEKIDLELYTLYNMCSELEVAKQQKEYIEIFALIQKNE